MALTGIANQSVGDPEGLTCAGGGNFLMSLERARKAALDTPIGNFGKEGISCDPPSGGYNVVRQ